METKSPREVAALLGVDEVTIRRLRGKAGLPERQRGQGYTQDEITLLRAQQRYKVHRGAPEEADPAADTAREMHANNAPVDAEMPASTPTMTARYEQLLRPSWEISRTFETNPDALSALADIARQNDRIIAQNDRIEQRLLDLSAALETLEGRLSSRASPHREATPAAPQRVTEAFAQSADSEDLADLAETMKLPRVSAPVRPGGALTKSDAARLVEHRHGVAFNTSKGWPWPSSALVSEEAAMHWVLGYVGSVEPHKRPHGWRAQCNVPSCPCHQLTR